MLLFFSHLWYFGSSPLVYAEPFWLPESMWPLHLSTACRLSEHTGAPQVIATSPLASCNRFSVFLSAGALESPASLFQTLILTLEIQVAQLL